MGHVYCMYNPEFMGILKIGYTSNSVIKRARQITSTHSPKCPWQVLFSLETDDKNLEKKIHGCLDLLGHQHSEKFGKEFYYISIPQAYSFFQAIGNMYRIKLQVYKFQYEGVELDKEMSRFRIFIESMTASTPFVRTQLVKSLPKGYWIPRKRKTSRK